jgi:hypothetical protein
MTKSIKTLKDLEDQFKNEPKKNKKINGVKNLVPDWNLNSRHLMIHLFFNILKENHHTAKDTLPSIDAEALEKMNTPIAGKLIEYRSNKKTLDSFKNTNTYIYDAKCFNKFDSEEEIGQKANIKYNIIGYDNIERIFPVAGESVPLNMDKRIREAFVVPFWNTILKSKLNKETLSLLEQIKE